jgi:hypothetical protein
VGGRERDRGRSGVERECVSVRGGEEEEREGGWTRIRWRESETNFERKEGDIGKGGREI